MTRTPTTTVNAIASAIDATACAFTLGVFPGGRLSGYGRGIAPSLSLH
ncbi:MAG TPA: hypothetical protein VMN79_09290 [Casimicrobiaceae bacterium]|nr:hypothetical protein [Casimicrobiaceae bacterium]